MALEIERKFLLRDASWRAQATHSVRLCQGYLTPNGGCKASVRVRISADAAYLNIKSYVLGISREEYEYPIPLADAEQMLAGLILGAAVVKERFYVPHAGHLWEIDVFAGANQGLVVAEVELCHPEEALMLPSWVGAEVSADPRYYNVSLVNHPYTAW